MPLGVRRKTTAPAARICFFSETLIPGGFSLCDFQQLDFEYQGGVRRDHAAGAARAVAEGRRDGELAPPPHPHPPHPLLPPLPHLPPAEREDGHVTAYLSSIKLPAL